MSKENLLIELGTEELPPKSLRKLAESFACNVEAGLTKADLSFTNIRWLASPRRLALIVSNLSDAQADKVVEKRGPAVNVAFDCEGLATKAAQGWARSNGITVEQEELVLVVDIGAGTSDFSVVKFNPNANASDNAKVISNCGVHVGGNDFDKAIP